MKIKGCSKTAICAVMTTSLLVPHFAFSAPTAGAGIIMAGKLDYLKWRIENACNKCSIMSEMYALDKRQPKPVKAIVYHSIPSIDFISITCCIKP